MHSLHLNLPHRLISDVAIECGTVEHSKTKQIAWIAVIVYPVGILVLNGSLLFCARRAILSGKPTTLSRSLAFLYREYEPDYFWWE